MGVLSRFFGRRDKSDPWVHFKGRQNSKLVLHEKALALAPVLIQAAHSHASSLCQSLADSSVDAGTAFAEALVVDLHVVDRVAFEQLGPDRRPWLMDPLISETASRLAALGTDDAEADMTTKELLDLYSRRVPEYANRSLIAERNPSSSGAADTIAWEFATHIGIGEQSADRYLLVLSYSEHFIALFEGLRLRDLVGT